MERKLIAAAVTSALAVPMAAQAVEFSVSGQVNRAVIVVDQDNHPRDGDLQHVDANSSQSRFRFNGSEELDSGLTVGVGMELGVLSTGNRDSRTGTVSTRGPTLGTSPSGSTNTRQAYVYLDGVGGRLTLGHTNTATDNMAHARLGGPSWLGGVTNWCAYESQGAVCLSLDGGRQDVLRYDTPSLGPVTISASTGDSEYWDARLTVAGSMGEGAYDFRAGYIPDNDASIQETFTTSGAVSFGQGTAIAAAWSKREQSDNRPTRELQYFYTEIDHSYGDGSVGVYWKTSTTEETGLADVDGTLWGIGMGHNIGGGATAYAGFRRIEADNIGDDVNLYLAGMRVTFN